MVGAPRHGLRLWSQTRRWRAVTFLIVKRDDGTSQWAFKGMPLYFFAGDAKAGDVNGDNQGGVWHVLRGESKKTSAAPGTSYSAGYNYN